MTRLALLFIVAISLAGCVNGSGVPAAFGPPAAQTAGELVRLTKPQFDAWVECAMTSAGKYITANESAATVARAAMTSCQSRERELENALAAYNRSRVIPAEVVARLHSGFVDQLTQMIIERRQDIKLARAYSEEWGNCLIEAAVEQARREIPLRAAVVQSYGLCTKQEEAFSRQLAKLISNPAAEIERRKGRDVPVLTKFVEQIRSGGMERPKRPDVSI